jgi:Zn-dependent metalloprotease
MVRFETYSNIHPRSESKEANEICFFIPRHIFRKIIQEGNEEQKNRALYDLILSERILGQRLVYSELPMTIKGNPTQHRIIYDMLGSQHLTAFPGKPMRYEGDSQTGDSHIDSCYDNIGLVYNFFRVNFNRNSIDDQGMTVTSSVHFASYYDNAFWNGKQLIYGNGSDLIAKYGILTKSLDVTAHEITHGIQQNEVKLGYGDESGGLMESIADCFAIMCLQWANNQHVEDSNWLIGEYILPTDIGIALRSLRDPGTANRFDEQIQHYRDFNPSMDPHVCSGIPNKAFYLACMKVGGYSWERIGKVWYITLLSRLNKRSRFRDMAENTSDVAAQLFGEESIEHQATREAWNSVGFVVEKPDLWRALKEKKY